jgi:soluble lytic murein transglycosylase-like protein
LFGNTVEYKVTEPTEVEIVQVDLISYYAKQYGQNETLARKIIYCESGNKKDAIGYNYRKGELWSTDIGYWQINNYYHQARMTELGLNIYNTEDNIKFGFMLLSEQGTTPWKASEKCWQNL